MMKANPDLRPGSDVASQRVEPPDVSSEAWPAIPLASAAASPSARLKVLSVASMFPNPGEPLSGLFVERRLAALAKLVDLEVLAAVPAFPLVSRLLGRYAYRSQVPRTEERRGIGVWHPRYFSVPRLLKPLDAWTLALSVLVSLRRLKARGFVPDLLDAHLAYPDGAACLIVRRFLDVPVAVTVRGHDINELPNYPVRGRQVRSVLARADKIFGVANALLERAIEMGAKPERTLVSPNGVDVARFAMRDRFQARERLGLDQHKKLILSVGYLVPRKGFDHLLRALGQLLKDGQRCVQLVIVGGAGGEAYVKPELDLLIRELGLEEHVRFVDPMPAEKLADWYAACDVFSLMSSKEGRPNVVAEALACGRPVVATRAWGTPELVSSPELGILVPCPPPPDVAAQALADALDGDWDEAKISASVSARSWEVVAKQLEAEMRRMVAEAAS